MKTISIQQLTQEQFKPFGKVIVSGDRSPDLSEGNFSWWQGYAWMEGTPSYGLHILQVKQRDMTIHKVEHHKFSKETIIPLLEEVIVVVGPAGELDENKLQAFRVPAGKGIVMDEGVKHFLPYPTAPHVDCILIFRRQTEVDDLHFENLSCPFGIS